MADSSVSERKPKKGGSLVLGWWKIPSSIVDPVDIGRYRDAGESAERTWLVRWLVAG